MEQIPITPFDKYANKPVSELLNDKHYLSLLMNKNWFDNEYIHHFELKKCDQCEIYKKEIEKLKSQLEK
jgi:hypothetical protein